MAKKLIVSKGILILDGVEWFLFARKYKKEEAHFKDIDDEVLILKTEILEFIQRPAESHGAQNLQDQRKINQ